jgi:hypothetical protein
MTRAVVVAGGAIDDGTSLTCSRYAEPLRPLRGNNWV